MTMTGVSTSRGPSSASTLNRRRSEHLLRSSKTASGRSLRMAASARVAVRRLDDAVTFRLEQTHEVAPDGFVILGDENCGGRSPSNASLEDRGASDAISP